MASILDTFGRNGAGVLGGVRNAVIDPTFLAGAGLMSGGGWGGAMQGAAMGQGIQKNDREEATRRRMAQTWGPLVQQQSDPQIRALLEAQGAEGGMDTLTNLIQRQQAEKADAARRDKAEAFEREKWGPQKGLIEAQTQETLAQAEERRRTAAQAATFGPYKDTKQRADVEEGLRKEISASGKDYVTIRDAHAKMQAFSKDDSAAGDVASVYSFMKMLDPGSVVREAEYATAENARGVDPTLRAMYNKLLTGERLTPAQRADFQKQADSIANTQSRQYRKTLGSYEGIADRLQVDKRNVLVDDRNAVGNAPQLIQEAQQAIQQGVPKEEVLQRLRENGINTEGL